MPNDIPKGSVCMPVYRSERFIEEAIRSVLSQTYSDFELIVVDDASPDTTYEIASTISDPRLSVYRNDTNLGPEGNWNRALKMARGRYIKVLPGDDTIYPDCLRRQVDVLEDPRNNHVVLIYCSRDVIDSSGKKVMRAIFPGSGQINGRALIRRTARFGTNIIGEPGAVLFRADAARQIGGFDASLGFVTDLDYWVRLLQLGDAYAIETALCTFRISGENWSASLGNERCRQYLQLLDRLFRQGKQLSRFDYLVGRMMAHINETLRRLVYWWTFGRKPKIYSDR